MLVQWFWLWAFTAEGLGLIPGWKTNIPQVAWHGKKKKKKKNVATMTQEMHFHLILNNFKFK